MEPPRSPGFSLYTHSLCVPVPIALQRQLGTATSWHFRISFPCPVVPSVVGPLFAFEFQGLFQLFVPSILISLTSVLMLVFSFAPPFLSQDVALLSI